MPGPWSDSDAVADRVTLQVAQCCAISLFVKAFFIGQVGGRFVAHQYALTHQGSGNALADALQQRGEFTLAGRLDRLEFQVARPRILDVDAIEK